MTQYDNTNKGALFPNANKQNPKHADYNGKINVGGVDYYLNGWKKQGQKGPFLSVSVKPVGAAQRPQGGNTGYAPQANQAAYAQRGQAPAPAQHDPFSDDIPF